MVDLKLNYLGTFRYINDIIVADTDGDYIITFARFNYNNENVIQVDFINREFVEKEKGYHLIDKVKNAIKHIIRLEQNNVDTGDIYMWTNMKEEEFGRMLDKFKKGYIELEYNSNTNAFEGANVITIEELLESNYERIQEFLN